MNQTNSKIFIIDSHPTFRYGLRLLIGEKLQKVMIREFSCFDSFVANQLERPDLIIAAVNDVKQVSMASKLFVADLPNQTSLVFYSDCCRNHLLPNLVSAVDEILDKSSDVGKILYKINSLLRWNLRRRNRRQQIIRQIDFSRVSSIFNLSAREIEIARYLTLGMRTSDISALMQLKPSTVSTYKRRILSKTETINVMELKDLMSV